MALETGLELKLGLAPGLELGLQILGLALELELTLGPPQLPVVLEFAIAFFICCSKEGNSVE